MKRFFYLSLFILSPTWLSAQTIYVANNNPGAASGVNVFTGSTAIADAMTAAIDGDIIYIVPSQVQYSNVTITKELTLFGIGLSPDKDLAARSVVGGVTIRASNVRFSGLFTGSIIFSASSPISGITIENSNIGNIVHQSLTAAVANVLVRNNIINSQGVRLNTTSNITISNNIIYGNTGANGTIVGKELIVFNNLFISSGLASAVILSNTDDCLFDHNIFYGVSLGIGSGSTGNVWDDNLSFGGSNNTFPVGQFSNTTNTSNIENVDPLFVNLPLNNIWLDSYDVTLQAGSPALNINGTNIGPSGGATAFDSEGNLLPLIETISLPAIIPVGTDLPVTIKAKGN